MSAILANVERAIRSQFDVKWLHDIHGKRRSAVASIGPLTRPGDGLNDRWFKTVGDLRCHGAPCKRQDSANDMDTCPHR
jgi:hypothetical protein